MTKFRHAILIQVHASTHLLLSNCGQHVKMQLFASFKKIAYKSYIIFSTLQKVVSEHAYHNSKIQKGCHHSFSITYKQSIIY